MSQYDPDWRKFVSFSLDGWQGEPAAMTVTGLVSPWPAFNAATNAAARPAPGGGGSGGGGGSTKPTLAIVATSAIMPEGNGGTTAYIFTVTRSGDISGASTATWTLTGSGPQLNAADFGGTLPSGGLFFAPGDATETITVLVSGDNVVELDEGFTVTLSKPSKGTLIGTASANGVIQNDDTTSVLPTLSIAASNAVLPEGNTGTTAYTFTVTRSGDTTAASSATWTMAGTGASTNDFSGALTGAVSFAAGQTTSQIITVNVAGDTAVEADEGFTVALSNPSGATIGIASAAGTILNDDTSLPSTYLSSAPGSNYNIQIVFAGTGWTPALTALVSDAADILSGIIVGDVSNIPFYPLAPYVGYAIDDVLVTVNIGAIDGAGSDPGSPFNSNIVAQTEINAYRDATDVGGATNELDLPVTSTITLDEFDIGVSGADVPGWEGVVLHELIHAVGFAAPIFDFKNLLGGDVFAPVFLGGYAANAYAGGSPLVEAQGQYDGVPMQLFDFSHWDEQNFNPAMVVNDMLAIGGLALSQELMTAAFTTFGEAAWLSDVTVGALADLGYSVADPSAGVRGIMVDSLFA